MLQLNPKWRFEPPADGQFRNASIPPAALSAFSDLIARIAGQGKRWDILEHFKAAFCRACGVSHVWSSAESWAETDLDNYMARAAENAPVFIGAFFDTCEELEAEGLGVPHVGMVNDLLAQHEIGYLIQPPKLLLRESIAATSVRVIERPPTVAQTALNMLHESLQRAERLQAEGHHREAVQETLWVLETLATAFRGVESEGDAVRGKYFNEIVRDLRRIAKGSSLERVLEWITGLHGYLSSPTGGGVRHGLDLSAGVPIGSNEARLYCNLIRSYVSYLLAEHESLRG